MVETGSVLVIGARGALGSALAADFEAAGWQVIRGARAAGGGASFRQLDLDRPETLAGPVAEADVVVNPVAHPGLAAERAVLAGGGLLINVSAQPAAWGLRLPREPARGTAILNAGRIPGLTSLLAADLLTRHPEADTVEIATTLSASGSSGPEGGRFLYEHLASARSGAFGLPPPPRTARRHPTTEVAFPAPIGRRRCLGFAAAQNGWLGEIAGHRHVACFMCLSERPLHGVLRGLNLTGLIWALPSFAFTSGRSPKSPSEEPVAMWVGARREGKLLGALTTSCRGDYRSTAAITRLLAEAALERGDRLPKGVLDVEQAFGLGALRPRLEAAGIELGEPSAGGQVEDPVS